MKAFAAEPAFEVQPPRSSAAACAPAHAGPAPDYSTAGAASPGVAESRKRAFVRHSLVFVAANMVSLACNGVLTFVLPRWLSVEDYGRYRLFLLYAGFAGLLHFGLLDGALVRWAVRPGRMKRELGPCLQFLFLLHAIVLAPAIIVVCLAFPARWWLGLAAATAGYAPIWNAAILGQFALQAGKRFGLLSVATVIPPALVLIIAPGLHFSHRLTLNGVLLACLGGWTAAGLAVWAGMLAGNSSRTPGTRSRSGQWLRRVGSVGAHNIRSGYGVLAAGLLTSVALSLDRLVVSWSFPIADFAMYSLAATAMSLVNTGTLSLGRVVFPYIAQGMSLEQGQRAYLWGESCLLACWAVGLTAYFPLRLLIEHWLPVYVPCLAALRVLMLATGLTAAIYVLHSNYFRAHHRQHGLLAGAAAGVCLAGVFLRLARASGSLAAMAWAMLAAIAGWWGLNEWLLRDLTGRRAADIVRALIFVALASASLLFCAGCLSAGTGAVVHMVVAPGLIAVAYGGWLRSLPWPKIRNWPTSAATVSR